MTALRNGAQVLLQAAAASGVRICFANPGTTELALVRALDDTPEIRPVLGLFEGVCTGAADGYARVSGQPALTLLHLGPGLANGLANLHNARRAYSPIINVVGDHASWHASFDAPLTSDIESLGRPMSSEVIRLTAAIGATVQRAVEHSISPPGSVVTLIAPSDVMERRTDESPVQLARSTRSLRTVSAERLSDVATRIADSYRPVLLLGSDALTERGQQAATRVATSVGARLLMEPYPALVQLGESLPRLSRLAYFPQDVLAQLGDSLVVIIGARPPVSYFGYEGQPSVLVQPDRLVQLTLPGEDSVSALEALRELLGSRTQAAIPDVPTNPTRDSRLTPGEVAEALVAQMPESSILSLEGSTCGAPYLQQAHRARRHCVLTNTGGAIGQGIPCAVGAALAKPDARVICLQSDGGAQYTLQALWTLAHEQLNVTVVICVNHRYGILQTELLRAGVSLDRPAVRRLTNLDAPRLDWVALAAGYGIPSVRVETSAAFHTALDVALRESGPYLIEAELST